ncbi:pyruvoyl-dependent arginine decarboxylase [Halovivax asiaticus JCM 14624]|uniref:arginine decarboxylase n=1 Tax=Halovivax asiaticus JCM 14624 TaxID=1227490 RepID=M0BN80_9EURY|nr:pyruvoyl-dependent arginine decarboxylase [Halovivax asiaticus]ELZ11049.1 pyruvoyl-dependent arginine decarboxylase [Halovivax asiaticus JCM 14624]
MSTIRVVWGSATGPTEMAAYDAALVDAGIENYNLVAVSSVIPAGVPVVAVGTAPDLGPAGERLTVVEGRARAAGPTSVSAGLGWVESIDDGPGLFYEAAGEADPDDVERRVREGIGAGADLREWDLGEANVHVEQARAESGAYAAAVVVAAYGESEPIV